MAEQRYRVFNKCKYDIGVTLPTQQDIVIKAGSFQLLTADDIVYIESICREVKFFSKRMLVAYDATNKEVPFETLGGYFEKDLNPHLSDDEIKAALKQPIKKFTTWLESITDEAELFAVSDVAKSIEDLPANKLKLINEKLPNTDILS